MQLVPRGRFGLSFRWFESCASTQRMLDGAPEGAVVAADEQTAGRGRLGRAWEAPRGAGLLFSIVLTPAVEPERLPELTVVAAEAVCAAIARQTGLAANVKPPNDVLVRGRKVAGILAEAAEGRVVLGAGVNVAQTGAQLPEETRLPATSLALEGATVERGELLATILEQLEERYDRWVNASVSPDT
jgi:BirA family biotin operon repressor/biotin-[acetyl-CoA-carboxylase] ligase